MNKTTILPFVNLISYIGIIVVNTLAVTLPINGKTTKELSDMYPNLFVPAGLTFSIWGVIYLLLGGFVVAQLFLFFKNKKSPDFVSKIGWLFALNGLANMSWIVAWHYQQVVLSLCIMLVILVSLELIFLRLDAGKATASSLAKWAARIPFSVYLGWISIATIANVTTVLVDRGWDGMGISESTWAILMMGIGTLLGLFFLLKKQNIAYALVIVWALYGIYLKRSTIEPLEQEIVWAAMAGMTILVLIGIVTLFKEIKTTT